MYVVHTYGNRAVQELIISERVKGTVQDWMPGYVHELNEVRTRRLDKLSVEKAAEVAKAGRAVKMRMRLEAKKDGRKKGRLIIQGFREPTAWDRGGTDSPVAAMASIRTLLFMCGMISDVISSIVMSTAFLQADEYPLDEEPRYVYYQPYRGAKAILSHEGLYIWPKVIWDVVVQNPSNMADK